MADGGALTNIQTVIQNIVTAINGIGQQLSRGQGNVTSQTVTTQTLITTGQGYLVNFVVVVAGTTPGTISNCQAISGIAPSNALVSCPVTAGVYPVGQAFSYGIVISPGLGQSVNVTYFQ